jgi:hypothetical protein
MVSKQFEMTKQIMTEQLLNMWTLLVSLIGCGFQLDKEHDGNNVSEAKSESECKVQV